MMIVNGPLGHHPRVLTTCDQRRNVRWVLPRHHARKRPASSKSLLAIVVTDHDDDERIHRYADVITQEAARWPDH